MRAERRAMRAGSIVAHGAQSHSAAGRSSSPLEVHNQIQCVQADLRSKATGRPAVTLLLGVASRAVVIARAHPRLAPGRSSCERDRFLKAALLCPTLGRAQHSFSWRMLSLVTQAQGT